MNVDDYLINANLDRSEDILGMLEDTFGQESRISKQAFERYIELTRTGSAQGVRLAAAYLEWCIAHPTRVGNFQAVRYCKCDNGFVNVSKEPEAWRPCEKCLPSTFDKWSGVTLDEDEDDLGFS